MSRDLGPPGSRQLLQLQLFFQIFEILDPPFYFIFPGSVWIHELCFVLTFAIVWIVLRSTIFMLFEKLLCLQILWVVEFKVQYENVVL